MEDSLLRKDGSVVVDVHDLDLDLDYLEVLHGLDGDVEGHHTVVQPRTDLVAVNAVGCFDVASFVRRWRNTGGRSWVE